MRETRLKFKVDGKESEGNKLRVKKEEGAQEVGAFYLWRKHEGERPQRPWSFNNCFFHFFVFFLRLRIDSLSNSRSSLLLDTTFAFKTSTSESILFYHYHTWFFFLILREFYYTCCVSPPLTHAQ